MKKKYIFLCLFLISITGCAQKSDLNSPQSTLPTASPIQKETMTPAFTLTPTVSPTPEPTVPIEYQKGILTDTGFESQWLNLIFTTPEGLFTANQNDLDDLMGIGSEVYAVKESGQVFNYTELDSNMELWCGLSHHTCVKLQVCMLPEELEIATAEEYLSILSDMYRTSPEGNYEISDITTEEFAGESYAKLEMTLSVKGETWKHQEFLVRFKGNRIIQVMFSYLADEEETSTRLKGAFNKYTTSTATGHPCQETTRATFQKGSLTDIGFESAWMNLRFTPSDNMYMVSQDELNAVMNISQINEKEYAFLPCVQEMVAMTTNQAANVLVMSEPLAMDEMSVAQYLQNLKMQFLSYTDISYYFDEVLYDYEIAGNMYKVLLLGADYQSGSQIYQAYCIRKQEDRLIVITFSWSPGYESELSTLLDCFSEY